MVLDCKRGFPQGTPVFPFSQNPAFDKVRFVLISIYSIPNKCALTLNKFDT